jgi:hypothetical protein
MADDVLCVRYSRGHGKVHNITSTLTLTLALVLTHRKHAVYVYYWFAHIQTA